MSRLFKSFAFDVKAVDDTQGLIEAYGSVFDNEDEGGDVVRPGAFKRTITNSKARVDAGKAKFLAMMLWSHDPTNHLPIGGWTDLREDAHGLLGKGQIILETQLGREVYALIKAGVINQFSIGYDIPSGGASYDSKERVRNLTELRLWEISPVTFAMNQEALLVGVKAATQDDKDAQEARSKECGIAVKDGGNVTCPSKYASFANKPDMWGDYTNYAYPLDTKAHADNAAARFGDQDNRDVYSSKEQGIIDKRIAAAQKKFGEDAGDDSKAGRRRMQRKTFDEHYTDEQNCDLLEDWCDVLLKSFTCAVFDAVQIGDTIESDVSDALDAFKAAVMQWVADAVKYDLSSYIEEQSSDYDGGTQYSMLNGGSSGYGWMSRHLPMSQKARKAMTAGDATTGGFTADHVAKLQKAATKALKATDDHVSTLQDAAAQVKSLIGSSSDSTKAGRTFSAANTQALSDHADALNGAADTLSKAMTKQMKAVNSVADDLATVLQGSEPAYGTDPGDAGDQQQGKNRANGRASQDARASRLASSQHADTLDEKELDDALSQLRKLRSA